MCLSFVVNFTNIFSSAFFADFAASKTHKPKLQLQKATTGAGDIETGWKLFPAVMF
jgi:hypothetical protein